jgi:protease-4
MSLLRGPAGLPRHLFENTIRLPAAIGARLGPLGKGGVWLVQPLRPDLSDAAARGLPFVGRERGLSFVQVLRVLDTARVDLRIEGVVLRFQGGPTSWTQALALRRAVLRLREAGKPVVAWGETLDAVQYLIASAATRVWLPEVGSLFLVGLRIEQFFVRDLLKQWDVEPEVIRIGSHKTAAELVTRDSMSPESQEQLGGWLDDVFSALVDGIAQGRNLSTDRVRELIDTGPHPAVLASEAGLIDGCLYADEVEARLSRLAAGGADAPEPEDGPGDTGGGEAARQPALMRTDHYFALRVADPGWRPLWRDLPSIAYVVAHGSISRGTGMSGIASDRFVRVLDGLRERDGVGGVVLRVDSPGGDAVASDLLYRAVARLAEAKPVVVSMGEVAASGGYYISAAADAIYAESCTITGSIGVVGGKLNVGGLYRRLGIAKDGIERGARAGLLSESRGFTPDERSAVKREMDGLYRVFLKRVADGRGLSEKAVEKVAGGRIWSGLQASRLGLVDELGGPLDALADLRNRMGLSEADRFALEVHPSHSRLAGLRALLGEGENLRAGIL